MPKSGSYNYPGVWTPSPAAAPRTRVAIGNDEKVARIDNAGTLVTMSTQHNKVHDAKLYTIIDEDLSVTNGKYWLLQTPDSGSSEYLVHFNYRVDADSQARIALYEGAVVSGSGTQLTSFNVKRAVHSGIAKNFFRHIDRSITTILDTIYHYTKRQMLTQLFQQKKSLTGSASYISIKASSNLIPMQDWQKPRNSFALTDISSYRDFEI